MDFEDWTQEAEKVYAKAIPAGSLEILEKLMDDINGARDLKVDSELKTLKNFRSIGRIKIPKTGSNSEKRQAGGTVI